MKYLLFSAPLCGESEVEATQGRLHYPFLVEALVLGLAFTFHFHGHVPYNIIYILDVYLVTGVRVQYGTV